MAAEGQVTPRGREVNPDALNALLGQAVQDMGAALQAPLILIGDKLGLYRAMGDGVPVSSTKSMMGHSLGAAGAVEAIVSLLALRHQFLPPNINFCALDDHLNLNIVANESRPAVVRTALSNSFGFGGTNASILFRRIKA